MAFAIHMGSAPSCPAQGGNLHDAAGFALRYGPELLGPASTPASLPDPGVPLPGTLASPRTGLSPAG